MVDQDVALLQHNEIPIQVADLSVAGLELHHPIIYLTLAVTLTIEQL